MIDKKLTGFTLIELLIVVAIVAILAGVVLIAVNPARQMGQARNAERAAEVNAILSAINQYQIDNATLPACITTSDSCIGTTGCCDLTSAIVTGGYIADIPIDPAAGCNATNTCYNVKKTTTNRVNVSAPNAELGVSISFTR